MNLYEVKVKYVRQTGEDNPGNVKETYLVDAVSCSEAEQRVIDEIKPFIFGDFEAPQIKKRMFFDVFPDTRRAFWYEAKVEMIVVDGDKEARKAVNMLVQGDDIHDALKALKLNMSGYDCEIISIAKSPVLDIFNKVA